MAIANDFADKLSVDGDAIDRGHDAWLRAKVERGLGEIRERAKLISVERICPLDYSDRDELRQD